eukprot:RCo025379
MAEVPSYSGCSEPTDASALLSSPSSLSPILSQAAEPLSGRQQCVLVICLLMAVLCSFCLSLSSATFPLQARSMEISVSVVGVVIAVYFMSFIFGAPAAGILCSCIGFRAVLYSGLLILCVGVLCFGMVPHLASTPLQAGWLFAAARTVHGLGAAFVDTSSQVCLTRSFRSALGAQYGKFETCLGVGFSLGAPVGAYLFTTPAGFLLPFAVGSALGGIALAAVAIADLGFHCFELPGDKETDRGVEQAGGPALSLAVSLAAFGSLMDLGILFPLITAFLAETAFGWASPTLPVYYRTTFGIPVTTLGTLYSAGALLYALASASVGYLCDRSGPHFIACIGVFSGCIAVLLLSCPRALLSCGGSLGFSVAAALMIVPAFAAVLRRASEHGEAALGVVAGVGNALDSLGEMTGPVVGAVAADLIGFVPAVRFLATVLLLFGISYVGVYARYLHAVKPSWVIARV